METLYTVQEAAEYLKVKNPTMYKYMDRGVRGVKLAYINVGGTRRIRQSAIDAFIAASTAAGELADDDRMDTQISTSGPVAAFAG
jgi:excisionase family DNA binding protein